MIRVVKDVVGNVVGPGVSHQGVRAMTDDQGRVAVFVDRVSPPTVYEPGEAVVARVRTPCACKGDAPRLTLARLWTKSETVRV